MINTVKAPAASRAELGAAREDISAALERKAPGGAGELTWITGAGWYRVARYVGAVDEYVKGSRGESILLAYGTAYADYRNTAGLLSVNFAWGSGTITPLGWTNGNALGPAISQARLVYDAAEMTSYVELYYNTDTRNAIHVTILGGELPGLVRWEPMTPILTSVTPRVYVTVDLTQPVATQQEVGTWTPTLYGATTAGSPTYSTRVGQYTRQGRVVNICGTVSVSALGGLAGGVKISGLPYACGNYYSTATIAYSEGTSGARPLTWLIAPNDTVLTLTAGQTEFATHVVLSDKSMVIFSGTYLAK